ncbi:MAG: hypothetical protein K2K29_04400 [Muribaculaceae bacterium]|nr:hypothetical protein [Muribaculaceae bacterium]
MARHDKEFPIITEEESKTNTGKFLIADKISEHIFKYSDLDAYRHVNTVRYVQLLMNQFSLEQHDSYFIRRMELSFLNEGKYGENLEILRHSFDINSENNSNLNDKDSGNENKSRSYAFLLRTHSDHTPILFSRIYLEKRTHQFIPN